jgi:hypothetical protein
LKSKDESLYESQKHLFYGSQSRFLKPSEHNNISYTSYPRSGNSYLRKYFENLTGVATGSDMVMKHTLNLAL